MTDNDNHDQGGPEWERSQAAKLWAAATMAGDEGQITLAANRMGDAVLNGVTSQLIDGLIKTFKNEVVKITAEREQREIDRDKLHKQRWDYTLDQLDQLIKRGNAQADLFGKLEGMPNAIETLAREVATRLGKLERGQGRLSTKMRESIADRADLRRLINEQRQMFVELAERFDGYIAAVPIERRNQLVAQIEEHQRRIDAIEARGAARGDNDSPQS